MPTLHVALQEGFEGDEVLIVVNGLRLSRYRVTTKNQIGFADGVDVEVPPGEVRVDVELTQRGVRGSYTLTVDGPAYLAVSVDRGGSSLRFEKSSEPFRYL